MYVFAQEGKQFVHHIILLDEASSTIRQRCVVHLPQYFSNHLRKHLCIMHISLVEILQVAVLLIGLSKVAVAVSLLDAWRVVM